MRPTAIFDAHHHFWDLAGPGHRDRSLRDPGGRVDVLETPAGGRVEPALADDESVGQQLDPVCRGGGHDFAITFRAAS